MQLDFIQSQEELHVDLIQTQNIRLITITTFQHY